MAAGLDRRGRARRQQTDLPTAACWPAYGAETVATSGAAPGAERCHHRV